MGEPEQAKWLEIVHDTNMDNDIRMTFDTHLITGRDKLKQEYNLNITLSAESRKIFFTRFLPKACSEVIRHIRLRIRGRKWN